MKCISMLQHTGCADPSLGLPDALYYLATVVWVKSNPGALWPGGTDGGRQVKLHASALWQTGVWTRIWLGPAGHGGPQIWRGVGAVIALGLPVCIMSLGVMMVVMLVMAETVPTMMLRVLHNVFHFWVIWMAWGLERSEGRGGAGGMTRQTGKKEIRWREKRNVRAPM